VQPAKILSTEVFSELLKVLMKNATIGAFTRNLRKMPHQIFVLIRFLSIIGQKFFD
jgi:hypothetical protein